MAVDLTAVHALTRAGVRTMRRVGDDMKRVLDRAASEERRTHEYRNRTYRLQGSTFALGPFVSGDTVEVEYGARMEYASFVDNRGLTRVRELAEQAETEIEYKFDADADTLSRM